ncbi:hypothetical protein M1432_02430 [Patescibacteria group bacterium]|nr:hypothetical protein [Patescibacteria group bacterium]
MDFQGNVMDCLRHFIASTDPRAETLAKKRELRDYAGVRTSTVSRWAKGTQKPVGLPYLKTMFFLETKGYVVTEIGAMDGTVRAFGRLVAAGAIPFDAARQKLSYKHGDSLLRVLHGKEKAAPDKIRTMAAIVEAGLKQARSADPQMPKWDPALLHPQKTVSEKEMAVETMAYVAKLAVLFGSRVVSDDFTAEDRRRMRALAGDETFFRASNLMSQLCSEKAREIISKKQ